jgi:hypothetical protein
LYISGCNPVITKFQSWKLLGTGQGRKAEAVVASLALSSSWSGPLPGVLPTPPPAEENLPHLSSKLHIK